MTPTARTLAHLQALGYTTEVTEHWIRYPGSKVPARRKDLLGFIDLIAMKPPAGVIGIQVTTVSNMGARIKKILTDPSVAPLARIWLKCGQRILVIGWKEYVISKGIPVKKWESRERVITLEDF